MIEVMTIFQDLSPIQWGNPSDENFARFLNDGWETVNVSVVNGNNNRLTRIVTLRREKRVVADEIMKITDSVDHLNEAIADCNTAALAASGSLNEYAATAKASRKQK